MEHIQPIITKTIPISYDTDDLTVTFTVEFGKGLDATYSSSEDERTFYSVPYDIQNYKTDDDINMYCLLAEEGSIVMRVFDVNVVCKTGNNKRKISNKYIERNYGITAVLDMKEPEYNSPTSFSPSNDIERDGKPWIILNNKILCVDQNGHAMFQWSTAKALDKGVKLTPEQELMGVEERHENTGMLYITFQPIYIETEIEQEPEQLTRGLTRGFSSDNTQSHAARVGYGSRAETKSKSMSTIPVPNSRFILPIRTRVIGDTFDPNVKCAKDLASAIRLEELQKKTCALPDW
jgi:hypothetical protein